MPELPEVETIKNTIKEFLLGETFDKVEVFYDRMILSGSDNFIDTLPNKKIIDIGRRGKYLLFYLSENYVILSHLRMEGKFYLLEGDDKITKHTRVLFTFKSGKRVIYDDSRMFGIMKLLKADDLDDEPLLNRVGPEPFDIKNADYLYERYHRLSIPIKTALLNQEIMAGLGNIYVDEVLFRTRLNPKSPASSLTKEDAKQILDNSILTLNKAIKLGGSTIRSYHAAKGVDGRFQNELLVYGKENEPCPVCNRELKKIRVNGRGTTFCPHCQKLKKPTYVIGITGTIASGKTTALNFFKNQGISTISCDQIVEELYHNQSISHSLQKIIKDNILDANGIIDKTLLRDVIAINPKIKIKVEKFIHPLVEDILVQNIMNSNQNITAIEIPLLFESKLDYLCDYIIALCADKTLQDKNLKSRDGGDKLQKIYDNDQFKKYQKYADLVIQIDENPEHLYEKLKTIIKKIKV